MSRNLSTKMKFELSRLVTAPPGGENSRRRQKQNCLETEVKNLPAAKAGAAGAF